MPSPIQTDLGYLTPFQRRVLDEAIARVGQAEVGGQNKGPIVEEVCRPFLSQARFEEEYRAGKLEWCAAFVCYCWWLAFPVFKRQVSLSVSTLWQNLSRLGWTWVAGEAAPLPGPADFIFFCHTGRGAAPSFRHVGLVESCSKGEVHTIEGNAFSGHGTGAVRRRTYLLSEDQIYGFARVIAQ